MTQALDLKTPASVHAPSTRPYAGLPELVHPSHDRGVVATRDDAIGLHGRQIKISFVFAGQRLGLREVEDSVWLVSFMEYDLGYIDLEENALQTIDTPFGSRASPMSPVQSVT